ncbi:MAG: nitroreductase family protein [Desulfobulbaceae bacterium]|nr:nitroreductase family protein [Desulfobulbaceae bacterium]
MKFHDITCSQCGACVRECGPLREAISLTDNGVRIDLELCMACGHCVAVCPNDEMEHPLSPRQPLMDKLPTPEAAAMFLRSPRSVRFYKQEGASREQLMRLLDMGRYAQTGVNSQGISYLALDGRDKLEALNALFCETALNLMPEHPEIARLAEVIELQKERKEERIFRGAPQLIIALADKDHPRPRENAQFSLTFIALFAPTLGLGTCWAGYFEALAIHDRFAAPFWKFLDLADNMRIRGALMVGIPDVEFRRLVAREPLRVDWR